MTISLSNMARVQIEAAAATLHPRVGNQFKHAVMRALSTTSQPPSMNDVLRSCQMALSMVPTNAVIISRSLGETTDDGDDFKRRY